MMKKKKGGEVDVKIAVPSVKEVKKPEIEITDELKERLMKAAMNDVLVWCKLYGIKNEHGEKLDFKQHLFLFDIYADFSPKQVIQKAAQIGFSTLAIIKSLWLAKNRGLDIIYTLPTLADVQDFVGGKVNRIVGVNPVLQDYVKDRDTVEQKRVGGNVIYFRGTWTEKAALMVSSDLNIYDEEDRSQQSTIQQYASRLQHSKYQWEWHFSNPSTQGNGVSRYWELSDQKEWCIICPGCKIEHFLEWPESIDPDKKIYICKLCGAELSPDDRRRGHWRPQNPGAEYSGYHISLLQAPWVSASQILDYWTTKSKEYFFNFVLGLPYVGEGNVVTEQSILKNVSELEIDPRERVVIGCDSGLTKHYVIGNRQGIFYYSKTDDWRVIEGFLRRYPQSIAVIDALPDLTEPRNLREKFKGRVFLCHYARDRKTMKMVRWGKGKEDGNVVVDRNRMMQTVVDEFFEGKIKLKGSVNDYRKFVSHWKTLYRLEKEDALGVPQLEWHTSTGLDHWCHATLYYRVGLERFGMGQGNIFLPSEGPGFFERGSMLVAGTDDIREVVEHRGPYEETEEFYL